MWPLTRRSTANSASPPSPGTRSGVETRRLRAGTDASPRSDAASGENSPYRMCTVCNRRVIACTCMLQSPHESGAADSRPPFQPSLAAAPAVSQEREEPALSPPQASLSPASPTSATEWETRYSKCLMCGNVKVRCLCMVEARPAHGLAVASASRSRQESAIRGNQAANLQTSPDVTQRPSADGTLQPVENSIAAESGTTRLTLRVRMPHGVMDGFSQVEVMNAIEEAGMDGLRFRSESSEAASSAAGPCAQVGYKVPGKYTTDVKSNAKYSDEYNEAEAGLHREGRLPIGYDTDLNEVGSEKERVLERANKDLSVAAMRLEDQQTEMVRIKRRLRALEESGAPNEILCPISSDIMRDPVICSDGHTYERAAIEKWISRKNTSPMTNQPLGHPIMLIPNHALRSLIASFVEKHGGWNALTL